MNLKHFCCLICMLKLIELQVESKPKNAFYAFTKNNKLSQTVMNLADCCVREKKITILLTDEMEEEFFVPDLLRNNIALINLFGNEVLQKHKRLRDVYVLDDDNLPPKVYPITAAIIAVSRADRLEKILEDLQDSIWWNHEANFIIVNRNAADSVKMAYTFLNITWTYSMLSVLYLCTSPNNISLLYAFNPYTDLAPKCWNKVNDQSLNTPWTLFESSVNAISQYFRRNDNTITSSELFFDKIKNLNRYNLKVVLQKREGINRYDTSKSGYNRFDGMEFKIMCTVLSHLNATVTVKFSSIPYLIDNRTLHGMAKDVIQGPIDIGMHEYILRDFWKVEAHSFDFAFLKFVSLKIPLSYGIASALTFKVSMSLLIIYIAFVQMLKYVLKVSTSTAVLEFVRIFTQSSTLRKPGTLISKMLLIIFIFATFTFSSYVQSLLKAISTAKYQISTIDTVNDLMECKLPIFATNFHKELISLHEVPKGLNIVIDIDSCFDGLRKGDQIVCLHEEKFIGYYLPKSDSIHISSDNLLVRSNAYIFSEDSPILQKFNYILLKMSESGFVPYIYAYEKNFRYLKEKYDEKEDLLRSLDLVYLSPIFYILAASWLLGVIIFCFELLSSKICEFRKFCIRKYRKLAVKITVNL